MKGGRRRLPALRNSMTVSSDAYWVALSAVRGVGPRVARLLLEKFSSAESVFKADEQELIGAGIFRSTARNIRNFNGFERIEKELCELPRIGARLVKWPDPEYPPNLKQIPDPPPFLFARGQMRPDERNCVAIVGARAASEAGRHMAQRLGLELAARGFAVVSGLARGIDSEAHQGALDGGGRTIAVMGCGIDVIYPAEHRRLADAIVEHGGALLSELPLGAPPIAENFPTRNRILSGLCLGVVIVEAAERSGSLITARLAIEQDRQVFAVPGSPLSGKTRGSNRLLKEGAVLVECVEDVIEELAPQLGEMARGVLHGPSGSPTARAGQPIALGQEFEGSDVKRLLEVLKGGEKLHIDSLIEGSALTAQSVLRLLLELELKGIVTQYPGKLFSLGKV